MMDVSIEIWILKLKSKLKQELTKTIIKRENILFCFTNIQFSNYTQSVNFKILFIAKGKCIID